MEADTDSHGRGICIEGWDEFMDIFVVYWSELWANSTGSSEKELAVAGICVFDGTAMLDDVSKSHENFLVRY